MYSIFVTVRDGKGDKSIVTVHLPGTTTLAYVSQAADTLADMIIDLTDGEIVDAGFTYHVDPASLPVTAADAESDVQEKALFVFEGENGFLSRVSIPAFKESLFSDGTDQVNRTAPVVATFTSAMTAGWDTGSSEEVFPSDYRGDDLETLIEARKSWARARR